MKLTGKFTQEIKDKYLKKIRDDYFSKLVKGNYLVNAILDLIRKGITPVKDAGNRFQKYSESYRKAIKKGRIEDKSKVSPVNMTQSGDMLKSLSGKEAGKFVLLKFSNKLAHIHDTLGAGKSKVIRRLLPHDGEVFTKRINDKLKESLKDAIAKQAKSKLKFLKIKIKF